MSGAPRDALPEGVLLAFYGDDFTGSTDAMEVTARAGLRTVLFTGPPSPEDLQAFSDCRVVGVAGTARSRSPEWMERHLAPVLAALASRGPPILQYKVCSTFDSAPEIGSIGKAIELGRRVVPPDWSPSIVGAPQLGRWQVFANLFAAAADSAYRIDRHPTMSRHPVTPMREADLRRHLAEQAPLEPRSVDIGDMARGTAEQRVREARLARAVTFIDVADAASQAEAGRLVWTEREGTLLSASSSGLQYALVAHWRRAGLIDPEPPAFPPPAPVDRLLVLSGSCSPVTARQIALAEEGGFASIRLDVLKATDPAAAGEEAGRILGEVAAAYRQARGVVVFAARTVDDPAFGALARQAGERGVPFGEAQAAIGDLLGRIAAAAMADLGLRRIVVAGGDTSGRVLDHLPVKALELKHPLSPGAPICRCHVEDERHAGLELVLKGGQLGSPDLFLAALGAA